MDTIFIATLLACSAMWWIDYFRKSDQGELQFAVPRWIRLITYLLWIGSVAAFAATVWTKYIRGRPSPTIWGLDLSSWGIMLVCWIGLILQIVYIKQRRNA